MNFIYGIGTGLMLSLLAIWGIIGPQTAYATMFGIFAGALIADKIQSNDK
jgi:hypothetical protein